MIIRDARTLKFDPKKAVFFDTNVWLSLFPATETASYQKDWARYYTALYERLIKYNVPIVINPMVLSEYINRFCRIEHEAYCKGRGFLEYKDFRSTDDFSYVASAASDSAKEILSTPAILIRGVDADLRLCDMIDKFATGRMDFNDCLYVKECLNNQWPLITNDSDFGYSDMDIEVWTANDNLINFARKHRMFQRG